MVKQSDFYKLIEELCIEKNIKMKSISYDYITELEKDGKIKHIVGTSLELNSSSSFKIASDKFATYAVLNESNIPTIKYNMIFNPKTRSAYENDDIKKAKKLFSEYKGQVILKANNSAEGKDVYLIKSEDELESKILKLFSENKDTLSVCPYYNIDVEYRVVFLDGECLFCYKKHKPYIIGDGNKTLKELININKIYDYLDLTYVPKEGEKLEISWKHNLSQGAIPDICINESKKQEVYNLAIRAGKALGITFACIDISETIDGELLVMEINSNVCMNKFVGLVENGREIEKSIFSKAIDKMF